MGTLKNAPITSLPAPSVLQRLRPPSDVNYHTTVYPEVATLVDESSQTAAGNALSTVQTLADAHDRCIQFGLGHPHRPPANTRLMVRCRMLPPYQPAGTVSSEKGDHRI